MPLQVWFQVSFVTYSFEYLTALMDGASFHFANWILDWRMEIINQYKIIATSNNEFFAVCSYQYIESGEIFTGTSRWCARKVPLL